MKFMNWTKQKGTTEKVETSKKFLEEEKFTFQTKIFSVIQHHDILPEPVLNLDQTPLLYLSTEKYSLSLKDPKMFPSNVQVIKANYGNFCGYCSKSLSSCTAYVSRSIKKMLLQVYIFIWIPYLFLFVHQKQIIWLSKRAAFYDYHVYI